MKKPIEPLPDPITLKYVVGQMEECAHASFHTAKSEDSQQQISHPKMQYDTFPIVTFTIDKVKEHVLEGGIAPHLFMRPADLEDHHLFLKVSGSLQSKDNKDHANLTDIEFWVQKIELKKTPSMGNKETFIIE